MKILRTSLWPIGMATVVGILLLPIVQHEYVEWAQARQERIERETPVVTMRGDLVSQNESEVLIRLSGIKHRDCRFLGLDAYMVSASGIRHPANVEKADEIKADGKTRPPGNYDFGMWRIWPTFPGAARAVVFVEHLCGGVAIRTLAAEVSLGNGNNGAAQ